MLYSVELSIKKFYNLGTCALVAKSVQILNLKNLAFKLAK